MDIAQQKHMEKKHWVLAVPSWSPKADVSFRKISATNYHHLTDLSWITIPIVRWQIQNVFSQTMGD
jgi:hypothetical protein